MGYSYDHFTNLDVRGKINVYGITKYHEKTNNLNNIFNCKTLKITIIISKSDS